MSAYPQHPYQQVGLTIMQQINANRLKAMWGAKNFCILNRGLSFEFMAKSANKSNCVRITLNGKDLYDVQFARIRGTKYTVVSNHEDVYNDSLLPLLSMETKLYTSLR